MGRSFGALALACLLTSAGCDSVADKTPTTPSKPTTPAPTVTRVSVIGSMSSAKPGDSAQFYATATLSNGLSQTVTTQATWESSDTTIVTVASSGIVTAIAAGQADIRATYQSVTGSTRLTVAAPPSAPAPTTFAVSGTIKDAESNATISGATVTVKNTPLFAFSDASGRYRVSGLTDGTITLRVTRAGYDAAELSVAVSGDTSADVTMKKSASVTER